MQEDNNNNYSYNKKFQKWVISSTSHGVPNIFRSKNPIIRTMWALVFLSSCSYCIFTIVKSILDFMEYKTTLSSKIIQEIPVPFPAITVCNVNPFNEFYSLPFIIMLVNAQYKPQCLDYLKGYNYCVETSYEDTDYCTFLNDGLLNECLEDLPYEEHELKAFIADSMYDENAIKDILGFDLLRDMLYLCWINRDNYINDEFTKFWNPKYGYCYTFNGDNNELHKTTQKGSSMGLWMKFALKTYQKDLPSFSSKQGLYLFVHNQSSLPFTLTDPIVLSPGNSYQIVIDRVFTKKMPKPYSNCIDELVTEDPYAERLFGFFRDLNIEYYDQDVCFNLCYQDKLIDHCGCLDIMTPKIRDAPYCHTQDQIECSYRIFSDILTEVYEEYCIRACPEKCNTVDYDLKISSAFYPTMTELRSLSNLPIDLYLNLPTNVDELYKYGKEAILEFTIYYENLRYTIIEENPTVTIEGLLGNVGGQLGLFIGISILSFVEIIEVAIEFINIYYRRMKQERASFKAKKESDERQEKKEIVFSISGEENKETVFTISNEENLS